MAISWKKLVTVAASVSTLGVLVAGCSTNNVQSVGSARTVDNTKPHVGGNITLDFSQAQADLDPALAYDTSSNELVDQMYDRLVTYAGTTNQIIGMGATTWDVSKDGKTYTFHLRKGVTFWNGDPVTAQSYIDEFMRVDSPTLGSPGYGFVSGVVQGADEYHNKKATSISGLSAPDDNTLVIKLVQPVPYFVQILAMSFFSAVDQKFIDSVGNKPFDSTKAMGSGPFELSKLKPGQQVVLTRNPSYWMKDKYHNQLPYLNQVTFNVDKNPQIDTENFIKGTTAFMSSWTMGSEAIPTETYPQFLANANLKKLVQVYPQVDNFYLGLNNKMAPFNNPKVRQAVEYAIDKKHILRLFNNRGTVANQPLPPTLDGYVKNLPANVNYSYNPAKAKQLLKAAGFKPGTPVTISSYDSPGQVKMAAVIQQDLNAVGFKATINTTTWAVFIKAQMLGKQQIFPSGWNEDYPDASDFMMLFQTSQQPQGTAYGNNDALYSNPAVDKLIVKAQYDQNLTERNALYRQATIQIMKDAPWVPLYNSVATPAVNSWVHNFYQNAQIEDPLQQIWIDPGH
jgi:ABC-type transport system substrate-binding protein